MSKKFEEMTTDERLEAKLISQDEAKAERIAARSIKYGEVSLVALRAIDAHDRGNVVYEVVGAGIQFVMDHSQVMDAEEAAKAVYAAGDGPVAEEKPKKGNGKKKAEAEPRA